MSDFDSSLPVRTQTAGDIKAQLVDYTTNTQGLAIDASGAVTAKLKDGSGNAITSQVNGSQQALDVGINVAGSQIDPRSIRALTSSDVVTANIKDATGTAFSNSNPLPVSVVSGAAGTPVHSYNNDVAVAAGSSIDQNYTVTTGKTLTLNQIECAASGKARFEIQIETAAGAGTFNTFFVGFNSTATPQVTFKFETPFSVASGVKVRVHKTNKDLLAQDLYATICGSEA